MAIIDSLVSYYKLDEASGNAIDAHGSNDLGDVTDATHGVTGKINDCWDTRASGGAAEGVVSGFPTSDTSFSCNYWSDSDTTGNNHHMVGWSDSANDNNRIQMWIDGSVYFFRSEDVMQSWSTGITPNTDQFDMVTWTYNATTNEILLYINGSEVADSTVTYTGTAGTTFSLFQNSVGSYQHTGSLDEVGVWTKTLNSSEITSLYNSGSGLAYPFSQSINFQLNIGDVWKEVTGMQINIGDSWKQVAGAQINIGDSWKTIF